jgi:hypothetical protein
MFENDLQNLYDDRLRILGKIKAKSLAGLDVLTLTALSVLAYAQLEGGMKDLSARVIRDINARNMLLGEISPNILEWRCDEELDRLKSAVNFKMVGESDPFFLVLKRKVRVRGIHRQQEMNQMNSATVKRVYRGFGISSIGVETRAVAIDELVDARNSGAHYGLPGASAASLLEAQLRAHVDTAEFVLTDFTVNLITYFATGKHRRI